MNFSELRFWGYLGAGLVCILLCRGTIQIIKGNVPAEFDKTALAGLGLYLLLCVSATTFAIFIFVMLTTWAGLRAILRWGRGSPIWLAILVPLQLAPLVYYKYAFFIGHDVFHAQVDFLRDLVIPVGISFYTFQKVAFAVDTLIRKEPMPVFLDYLNFAGFFPQIVAGPIERRSNLLPQMQQFSFRWIPTLIEEGSGWIVLGLFFKCVLADNLSEFFDGSSIDNPFFIWKANLIFALRIYYDFAGYSLVAFGVAIILGVKLTLNFESPYASTSPSEFWRRWHITLSQWFRDYLYIPLGGSRVSWWAFNVGLVFVISGIWHGAGWNFLIWGLLHGILLIAHRLSGRKKMPPFLGWLGTMVAVCYTWLCFYETRPGVLSQKIQTISNPLAYSSSHLRIFLKEAANKNTLVFATFLMMAFAVLLIEWWSIRKRSESYCFLRKRGILLIMIFLIVWLAPGKANDFIYFAF